MKKKTKPLSSIKEEEELVSEEETEPVKKENVKIRFDQKTKRLADSSDDDEEIEKQIQKLQAKKKKKPVTTIKAESKSQPVDVQPVVNKKPKAWEIAHLRKVRK